MYFSYLLNASFCFHELCFPISLSLSLSLSLVFLSIEKIILIRQQMPYWFKQCETIVEAKKFHLPLGKLSWVVPSSILWVKVEWRLSWSWIWVWAWQVFELFNWSIGSRQLKFFKSCFILLLSRLGGGWLGGCVIWKKGVLSLKDKVKVELRLSLVIYHLNGWYSSEF